MATHNDRPGVTIGPLQLDFDDRRVIVDGRDVMVMGHGFDVLAVLGRHAGEVVSREDLFGTVWGSRLRASDRSVDVTISKVRRRLERASPGWQFIHTHSGWGYRLQPERRARHSPPPVRRRSPRSSAPQAPAGGAALRVGNLELWPSQGQARVAGAVTSLTPLETALLEVLMAAPSHVVSKSHMSEQVSAATGLTQKDGTVETYVHRVRAKLSAAAPDWNYIHTRTGRGYWLEPTRTQRANRAG